MFFEDDGTMMASGSCRDDKSTFENESALGDGRGTDVRQDSGTGRAHGHLVRHPRDKAPGPLLPKQTSTRRRPNPRPRLNDCCVDLDCHING